MKIRPAVTTATAALGLLAAAFATTAAGAAASPSGPHHKIQRLTVLQPRYDEGVRPNISRSAASKASAPSIRLFHSTVSDGATTFPYTMVGKNPFTAHANGAANVKTVIVPVVIKLTNGDTFNPRSPTRVRHPAR